MSVFFPEKEKEILDYWQKNDIFKKSLEKNRPLTPSAYNSFIFYDGPPFATGLPHHGHLLASTIKDIIPRFKTMQGKYVPRRWGWDCHGLPIEHEIDKALGMSAQEAVAKLGVRGYNDKCREIVDRYTAEWQQTITRLGRWVDFEDHYKTMDPSYMESVWWVFRELWQKDLIYLGTKVMPYSTALQTPISNFEASSNYQTVQDPAVVVLFEEFYDTSLGKPKTPTYYAAWTTTPWTLPANLALCINPELTYVKVHISSLEADVILAKECLKNFKGFDDYPVVEEIEGDALVGNLYFGLYPWSESFDKRNTAFTILSDEFVKTEAGTGVVHIAPAFGEDDARVATEADIEPVCPINKHGQFTSLIPHYEGVYVKDADPQIIKDLKSRNRILHHSTIKHKYPFCPRSDTPLLYKSVPAWYIAVEKIKDELIRVNQRTHWVPETIRDGRFGNWLENAKDWCVSRNRIWGTPLPIWINDKTGNSVCIGSLSELRDYTGEELPEDFDLHRENVDNLTFTIKGEEGIYRRIEEVFDCWFESGAMPYAQEHHPFSQKGLSSFFPADFIAEGIDQTRGWFYTLMVLSTALQKQHPFKNVIVNGIVLAADGKKMAKRLRNYTDPNELLEKYGADAFRLYLIDSGLVKAENLRFKDKELAEVTRRVLLPIYNAYSFLETYAKIDGWEYKERHTYDDNILDQWIKSRINSLANKVSSEIDAYRLYNVMPEIYKFVDDLTNWYIRLSRRRFYVEKMTRDKEQAFATLWEVLEKLTRVLAPLTPFISEYIYQELLQYGKKYTCSEISVHLNTFPNFNWSTSNINLEKAVKHMQEVIILGRKCRDAANIKIKIPLSKLLVISKWENIKDMRNKLEAYIKSELNVKTVTYSYNEEAYTEHYAKPNFPILGARLGNKMQDYKVMIECLDNEDLKKLESGTPILLDGEIFDKKEITILRRPHKDNGVICGEKIAILLDTNITPELHLEGLAREVVNRIQKARKKAKLEISDRIKVFYHCDYDGDIRLAMVSHADYIKQETLALDLIYNPNAPNSNQIFEETEIESEQLLLKLRETESS